MTNILSKQIENFKNLPEELKTYTLCLDAILHFGYNFKYVPEKFRTPELCRITLGKIESIAYVPKKDRTYELCLEAVKDFGRNLIHVPEHLQTNEICKIAIQQDLDNFYQLKNPSEEIINFYNLLSI
jgi:hypothetical protein